MGCATMKRMIGRRLLVVDPNRATAELLRDRLDGPMLAVRVARSADEALSRLDREHFDAIVGAMEMPPMGGLEMVRALRRRGQLTPVMLLSSDGERVARDDTRVMTLGQAVVMPRPVRLDWLHTTLESILNVSLDRRESRRSRRVPLRVQVLASTADGRELRGTSVNLSEGGLSFRTSDRSPRTGESLEMALFFHGRPFLTVRGRVVHARDAIGVEFTDLGDRQRERVAELLGA